MIKYGPIVVKDMKKRELKPSEYADLMGVTVDTVYRWKRGDLRPSRSALLLMQFTDRQIIEAHRKACKMEGKPSYRWGV